MKASGHEIDASGAAKRRAVNGLLTRCGGKDALRRLKGLVDAFDCGLGWRSSAVGGACALAQDKGTLDDKPLPPLANPADPSLPAKQVFGRALTPIEAKARSIGYYWRGCLAGARALPVDGESWQVVRLSRNRMWGNPAMIAFLERFSRKAKAEGVWNGILVGDISQPRGGPMLTGHASHQVGLDADVWLTPMPDHTLSREEREEMSAVNMVTEDGLSVDRCALVGGPGRNHQGRRRGARGRAHLRQRRDQEGAVRDPQGRTLDEQGARLLGPQLPFPYPHQVPRRARRPATRRTPCPPGDGCDKSLAWWFTDEALHPAPSKPKPPITMAQLPPECRTVAFWRSSGRET